jgi:uncharacterized protein (DUF433 family)
LVVSRQPEVHSGHQVFAGTRVPVDNLIDYLKGDSSQFAAQQRAEILKEGGQWRRRLDSQLLPGG